MNQTANEQRIRDLQEKHQRDLSDVEKRAAELLAKNVELSDQVTRLNEENTKLRAEIEDLKKEKELLEKEVERLTRELVTLQQRVTKTETAIGQAGVLLKQQRDDFDKYKVDRKAEDDKRTNALLLGEVALKFDRSVVQHVFENRFKNPNLQQLNEWKRVVRHITISVLVNNQFQTVKPDDTMSTDEQKRLDEFLCQAKRHGWNTGFAFCQTLGELKGVNRADYAHLTIDEKKDQTLQTLRAAVQIPNDPDRQSDYEEIINFCDFLNTTYPLRD